jgi:hypothetical protein
MQKNNNNKLAPIIVSEKAKDIALQVLIFAYCKYIHIMHYLKYNPNKTHAFHTFISTDKSIFLFFLIFLFLI